MRKAWTMVELIFVIVIIGVLAGIAIPKFSDTKNAANIVSAKATVASVKSALSTERQLRVLRGDFGEINSLNNDGNGAFTVFNPDRAGVSRSVLESTVPVCVGSETGCWQAAGTTYTYVMPAGMTGVATFTLANGQFNCDPTDTNCQKLTQ